MSQAVENPVDVDLFSNLHADNEVQTTSNVKHNPTEALVRKCLHPPSAVPEFCGLPTNDARSQVCIEWRNMELMNSPRLLDANPTSPDFGKVRTALAADLATFDYAFLVPNGARVKAIGYLYNSTAGRMMQDFAGVSTEQLYNFDQWRFDVNQYRPTYKSSTFYLNATAFNDTGMVVGNQFNPNVLFAGTLLALSQEQPQIFYSLVKSSVEAGFNHIVQRPSKELSSVWERIPHYHRTELLRICNANPTDIINLDPNTSHQVVSFGQLGNDEGVQNVPNTSQILGNSLRSLGCKAKEGMFSVNRLNTVTPAWLSGSNTYTVADGIKGLYQCWVAEIDGTSNETILQPLYENAAVGTASAALKALYDTIWSKDMTWSWVRFSGLSLNSQTSVSTQLLIKKFYSGYEVQPCTASAWSGMMKLGPKPDIAAMQQMMDGFYDLKDVMPARYNFWGTISSLASAGVKGPGTRILSNMASKLLGLESSKKGKNQSGANSFIKSLIGAQPNKSANKGRPQWANPGSKPTREVHDIDQQIHALSSKIDKLALSGPGQRRRRAVRPVVRTVIRKPRNKTNGRPSWAN